MATFICATDARANRTVRVETDTTPTPTEVHRAHAGYGLGCGNHNVADMIREEERPRPFLNDRA